MNRSFERKNLKDIKRIIIKVGSRVLASPSSGLNLEAFASITRQISSLIEKEKEVILVTSGAIAAGMRKMGLKIRPRTIPEQQAAAAAGQSHLMHIYEEFFSHYNQKVAQVLLTHNDLANRDRFIHARNTLKTLLSYNIIPIINENDSVVVEEIKFGDNDNLSALITNLVDAELLLILSDVEGLYETDPKKDSNASLISVVSKVDKYLEKIDKRTKEGLGRGGIYTKLKAAKKAAHYGIPTIVASGYIHDVILRIIDGEEIGTLFLPEKEALPSRKHWIAYALKPCGEVIVDEGAKNAICNNGKSLLPSGVVDVKGNFKRGDLISCIGPDGKEFARGLALYSKDEIQKIKGVKTKDIINILGFKYYDEIIHRDDLVIL